MKVTGMRGTGPRDMFEAMCRRRRRLALMVIVVAATAVTLAACSGGGGGGGSTVTTPPPVTTPTGTTTTTTTTTPATRPSVVSGPAWLGYGGNAQHTSTAQIASQPLSFIAWKTPVDMAPQYSAQGYLLTHYGSPAITTKNTVIVPVKGTATGNFLVEAHAGSNGAVMWTMNSDWVMPPHNWIPSFNVTLTAGNKVYAPGAGGKVFVRDDADAATSAPRTLVFYGESVYNANKAALDASVFINTPITADTQGNIYFGFTARTDNPAGLSNGFVRIAADGTATTVGMSLVAGELLQSKPALNAAPALSPDQKTLYVLANDTSSRPKGYLMALDAASMALKAKILLLDPQDGTSARASDDGTASPMVGPDGDVYIGVLESVTGQHNQRGWMLHFDATLAQKKIPGSFGWDITPSVVPAAMVPSYKGSSTYLLASKYNNYGRAGTGDGKNRIAIIDPFTAQTDTIAGIQVMQEVLTMLAPTPDPNVPGGVIEWCINIAAVDPFTKSVLVNSEDGNLYRWDLTTNTLSEKIRLTSGLGESYTPTLIGPDGTVYAINNAVLFAVGK
jgi:hypothetical protein